MGPSLRAHLKEVHWEALQTILKFSFSISKGKSFSLQKIWSEAPVCRPGAVASAPTPSYMGCTLQRGLLTHTRALRSQTDLCLH